MVSNADLILSVSGAGSRINMVIFGPEPLGGLCHYLNASGFRCLSVHLFLYECGRQSARFFSQFVPYIDTLARSVQPVGAGGWYVPRACAARGCLMLG